MFNSNLTAVTPGVKLVVVCLDGLIELFGLCGDADGDVPAAQAGEPDGDAPAQELLQAHGAELGELMFRLVRFEVVF